MGLIGVLAEQNIGNKESVVGIAGIRLVSSDRFVIVDLPRGRTARMRKTNGSFNLFYWINKITSG